MNVVTYSYRGRHVVITAHREGCRMLRPTTRTSPATEVPEGRWARPCRICRPDLSPVDN